MDTYHDTRLPADAPRLSPTIHSLQPADADVAVGLWDGYSPKSVGPKYPPHNSDAPIFGGLDLAALLASTVMALGPLTAYASGFGL